MLLQKAPSQKIKQKAKISSIEENVNVSKVEPVDPELILPGDKVIVDESKKKTLSPLKKVEGVLNYFQEIKQDKEKSSLPRYLYDITIDTLYLKKCQNFINKCYVRLPIIVINMEYYEDFKYFLSSYYQYEKFKKNSALLDYLILSDKAIKNYEAFHESQEGSVCAAECINTALINHYDSDKIYEINKKLEKFFKDNNIKGMEIDFYYDEWINNIMDMLFSYILFNYNVSVKVIKCEKCKKTAIFTEPNIFSIFPYNEGGLYEKIYEDMQYNETYPKSVDIANNMINNVDFSNINLDKKDKDIKRDNSLLNIIYYDEGINDHRNEIVGDSFVFEKECNGTLLLVTSIKSMILLLGNIKKSRDSPTFLLICTGSAFENLMKYIQQYKDLYKYISSAIIYTYNSQKYAYLLSKYNIIKGIYAETEEIVDYIRKHKSNKNIKYKVPILITYKEYNEKYIQFHKIISLQYGKLYQKSSYLTALNILEEYLKSSNKIDNFDLKLLIKNLEVFSQGPRDYKKIINEYTNDSFYSYFNKWLNQIDPLAIRKIAFFISGLQLSLNIYGKKDQRGFNFISELYRGALFNYSLVLNYERNVGNIITYPSFFSTTLDISVAKDFSQFNSPKEDRNGLFSVNYIIRIIPKDDWIAQGFNISNISTYKSEKEILFQPFCFFRITKVEVDLNKNLCFIYLELIGKKEIWELSMNNNSFIVYQ